MSAHRVHIEFQQFQRSADPCPRHGIAPSRAHAAHSL